MTVSKTKAKLVDVARQLFAKMGVENTTMNDIALASKKGRRTLYKTVLLEGQAKGVFHIDDVEMTADLIHYCVKGIEVPYIRGHIGAHLDEETRNKYVSNIVFGALHRTEI